MSQTNTERPIYLPPSMAFNTNNFYDLLQQLPPPILITGNFSSHSTLWGCTKLDRRAKMMVDILTTHNLCILNDSSSTYIHPATGSSSAIDFSICSPDIFLDTQKLQWKSLDDLCGSDHCPISVFYGSIETSSAIRLKPVEILLAAAQLYKKISHLTRKIALSCGMKISPIGSLDESQSTHVTDGRTDGQTDRNTTPKTALA